MNRINKSRLLCGLLAVISVPAMAALPAEATAAFTAVSGSVTDIFAAVWPIVGTVVGGFVMLKLFKRGSNKI